MGAKWRIKMHVYGACPVAGAKMFVFYLKTKTSSANWQTKLNKKIF